MTEDEIRRALGDVLERFAPELAGVKVVLFGSRAEGADRERSDVDLGLLGAGQLPAGLVERIRDDLEALPTLIRFDLVDLRRVGASFRKEALRRAEVLFEN